jgi:membrane protein
MGRLRSAGSLVRQVVKDYFDDKAPRLAAALAYYALFAIAPLLLVVIAVGSLALGPDEVREVVQEQASAMFGAEAGAFVGDLVERVGQGRSGVVGAALGTALLLAAATGLFVQLQDALNTVWDVRLRRDVPLAAKLLRRVRAFVLVMGVAVLLLGSLAMSAALAWTQRRAGGLPGTDALWAVLDFALSFWVLTVVFALMFKVIPDAEVRWSDVWLGGAVTALLFVAGKLAIGFYLGQSDATATFGAASAVIVLILWVYYCAQLILLGAEVTQAIARRHGGVRPSKGATRVTTEARLRQGMGP